jgi:nucleoside-diphosphate-sugar epimerase
MAGRRVLLFGASGFLGRAVGAALDCEPRVDTVIRSGRTGRLGEGWVNHDLIAGDPDELAALIRNTQPDAVINCVGRLSGNVVQLTETNVLVTAHMIEIVAREAPTARLVILGSAAEYGPTPYGRLVGEDDPVNPVAMYGVTRLASTRLVQLAARDKRLDAVVLRIFNPIGPHVPHENVLGRAIAGMQTALNKGEDSIVLGPLDAYRDFVDVRDVAAAITAAALADQVEEPVLNVGSGRPVLCRELVATLAEVAGFTGTVAESSRSPDRSSLVDWSVADVSRIQRALAWKPTHDLRASVEASWSGRDLS